jgi:hypothetical protein
MLENMLCNWLVISSMPGGAMISTPTGVAASSISISFSSSSPSRSFLRQQLRVVPCRSSSPGCRAGGSRHRVHALFGGFFGAEAHLGVSCSRIHLDGDIDQVADDGFHIAPT